MTFSEKNQTMYTSFDGDSVETTEDGMKTPAKGGSSITKHRKTTKTKTSVFEGVLADIR